MTVVPVGSEALTGSKVILISEPMVVSVRCPVRRSYDLLGLGGTPLGGPLLGPSIGLERLDRPITSFVMERGGDDGVESTGTENRDGAGEVGWTTLFRLLIKATGPPFTT